MQLSAVPVAPVTLTLVPWRPNAGRGGNHLPSDHAVDVGEARLPFAPMGPAYAFRGGVAQAHRGVEVFVESGSAAGVLDALRGALDEVPPSLLERVAQVRVLARQDDAYDKYYERAYGIPGFQAVAAGGGGTITFFGGRPYAVGVLFHELGHNLSVSGGDWRSATRADDATLTRLATEGTLHPVEFEPIPDPVRRARWTPRLAPGPVTPYGGSATGEDIAEALHQLLSERHFGHAFASITAATGVVRELTFAEAYPARTAVLERAARFDLDGDGTIGS